jgi:hypothetical protein
MNENSIVTGIRQKRAEILASYHGDYHAMMHDMMQRQWTSGHKVVHLAPPNVRRATAPSKPKAPRGKP